MARKPVERWSLKFEGLGRVERGEIRMTPLVVLVGPNNSGKSYVAATIWSLLDSPRQYFRGFAKVPEWFTRYAAEDFDSRRIPLNRLQGWMNAVLAEKKDKSIQSLLSNPRARIRKLSVKIPKGLKLGLLRNPSEPDPDYLLSTSISFNERHDIELQYKLGIRDERAFSPFGILLNYLAEMALFEGGSVFRQKVPTYLPAARTGLLLSLPFILDDMLEGLEKDEKEAPGNLTLPTSRFLRQMINLDSNTEGRLAPIARFIEENIVRGVVSPDKVSRARFNYTSDDGITVPLHAASSMVSEIAPLLLLLKHGDISKGLVLEEPESHLHLSAQRILVRAIIRLVNAGVHVTVTTHSDTIIQQLNILISLSDHPDKDDLMKQFGYDAEDLLDRRHVSAYEFNLKGDRTILTEALLTEDGFAIGSLNDVIVDIGQESLASMRDADSD